MIKKLIVRVRVYTRIKCNKYLTIRTHIYIPNKGMTSLYTRVHSCSTTDDNMILTKDATVVNQSNEQGGIDIMDSYITLITICYCTYRGMGIRLYVLGHRFI